jgi:hypothetical protein
MRNPEQFYRYFRDRQHVPEGDPLSFKQWMLLTRQAYELGWKYAAIQGGSRLAEGGRCGPCPGVPEGEGEIA